MHATDNLAHRSGLMVARAAAQPKPDCLDVEALCEADVADLRECIIADRCTVYYQTILPRPYRSLVKLGLLAERVELQGRFTFEVTDAAWELRRQRHFPQHEPVDLAAGEIERLHEDDGA